ncbi:PR15B phosphatase, partial [Polyodon spathula]|nr:PR15B phosphatase [Polyodon spathula]
MFSHRRVNSDGLYTKELTGPSSSTQLGVPSHEPGNQDSSWIGFFSSMISRPYFSFLQRYLPGRHQTQSQSSSGAGWIGEDFFKQSLACEQMFLARLEEDCMQTEHSPPVGLLNYQYGSNYCNGGSQEPFSLQSTGTSLDWFTKDGLGVMGIHGARDTDMYSKDPVPTNAYAARHYLNQVFVNVMSAQDAKSGYEMSKKGQIFERDNPTWVSSGAATAGQLKRSWWEHLWGTGYNSTAGIGAHGAELSGRSGPVQQSKEKDSTGFQKQLQPSHIAIVSMPQVHIVPSEGDPLCTENAGYQFHKVTPPDNASSQTTLPELLLAEKLLLAFGRPCACAAVTATATFSTEAVVLTPDQDNGYSSWEEEHFGSKSHKMEACCTSQVSSEAVRTEQQSCAEVGEPHICVNNGNLGPEGEMEQRDIGGATLAWDDSNVEARIEVASQSLPVLTSPQCQNKTIAFIMGAPCSEESESESESDLDWDSDDDDDDDDGFSSEGSSDFSESEEEEGGTEEAEKEMLWNLFSQSRDPYNPQNFTAAIQTVKPRAPFEEDVTATSTEEEVTDAECSPGSQSPWDSEDDHSSCDEAESLKLWNSFSCRGDPYSPLNFMVPISTKQVREQCSVPSSSKQKAGKRAPSPCMQMEEAEERLDSGFSETFHIEQAQKSSNRCGKQKKVMFVDEVEEFYASCDEDRRGPWEELARDRCRFLRRVQETEDAVGCCLAPAHRQKVFERLYEKC